MTWLNAALAFAITMLILSMVTSVFVETIHRLIGLREKGLANMLGHFYDRVIDTHVRQAGETLETTRQDFVDSMTINRGLPGVAGGSQVATGSDGTHADGSLMSRIWSGRRLSRLGLDEFMSRLGSSPFGDALRGNIAAMGEDTAHAALKDVAQKFEAFGHEAGVFFERRARLLSVLVALGVAWFACVNPYDLMRTYLSNEAVTKAVLDMQETVMADYEKVQKARIAEKQDLENKAADKAVAAEAESAKVPDNNDLEAKAAAAAQELEAAKRSLDEAIAGGERAVKTLQEAGVPIGWTPERLAAAGFYKTTLLGINIPLPTRSVNLAVVFWLFAGGLLIGLGGPFWYDAVKSLTSIKSVLGGAKATTSADTRAAATETAQPETPVEHFMTGAAGRDAANGGPPVNANENDDAVG